MRDVKHCPAVIYSHEIQVKTPENYLKLSKIGLSITLKVYPFNVLDMSAKGYCFAVSCFLSGCTPCIDFVIITSLLVNRYKVKQNNWTVDKNFVQFNLISRTVQWMIHLFSFVAEVKSCNFLFGGSKKNLTKKPNKSKVQCSLYFSIKINSN